MKVEAEGPLSSAFKTTQWDPQAILGIINPDRGSFTCVGYAKSKGRRCRNPIRRDNRDFVYVLIHLLTMVGPKRHEFATLLEEAADRSLCWLHEGQVDGIAEKWKASINALSPPTPKAKGDAKQSKGRSKKSQSTGSSNTRYIDESIKTEMEDSKRKEREQKEREQKEQEQNEREQKEREEKEREQKEREEKEREQKEREQKEREQKERRRKKREQKEWERMERERKEQEQKEKEQKERERKEQEQKEREQKERRRKKRERKEREEKEREQKEWERKEREWKEREWKEREWKEQEQKEQEQKEQEQKEQEQKEREQKEREQKEREEDIRRAQQDQQRKVNEEEQEKQNLQLKRRDKDARDRRQQEAQKRREREQQERREQAIRGQKGWQQWQNYVSKWSAFKRGKHESSTVQQAQALIPWPAKSGRFGVLTAGHVKSFYRETCLDAKTAAMFKTMQSKSLKWQSDKMVILYHNCTPGNADKLAIEMICRIVVLELREEARVMRDKRLGRLVLFVSLLLVVWWVLSDARCYIPV